MDGDRNDWIKGLRLTLVAALGAVIAATVVIQAGSGILERRQARAAPVILVVH